MSLSKIEAVLELIKDTDLVKYIDLPKVVEISWIINCGHKPIEAMELFNRERIFWLMDDRSVWIKQPPER